MRLIHAALATMATLASATTHLDMSFDAQDALAAWTQSTHRDDYGKVSVVVPKFGTAKGIKTMEDARHYAVSTAFDKPIDNSDKPLVIQFSVKVRDYCSSNLSPFSFFFFCMWGVVYVGVGVGVSCLFSWQCHGAYADSTRYSTLSYACIIHLQ